MLRMDESATAYLEMGAAFHPALGGIVEELQQQAQKVSGVRVVLDLQLASVFLEIKDLGL